MRALPLVGCFLALLLSFLSVAADEDDVCRFFSNNTVIRDPDSCRRSIKCIDSVSHYSTCSASTPFYDKDTNKCVKALHDHSNCEISCANWAKKFIADPKSCYGYYYCEDEELALYGKCPSEPDRLHFNQTQQACIYKYESECRVHQFDFCSIVKDGVNFQDTSSCANYYVCTKGELTQKSCSGTYYNPATGKCVPKAQVACKAHPLPKDACGTEKKPKKNVFVNDGATCNGYFFCADANGVPDPNPVWSSCATDLFFDEKTGKCVHPTQVQCSEDRCVGRTPTFVSSSARGCRGYLRCQNGVTVDSLTCTGNLFFDEFLGACTSTIVKYPSCAS